MNIIAFILIFFLLQGICVYVGRASSKKIATEEDYFLAGRKVRFFPLLMTLVATQIGGGLILGSCEEAYKYGWIVLLYPLGATLGLLALAFGVGKRLSRFNVGTIAELFQVVYSSKRLKKIASSLSIISLFFILAAQVIASKKFMISLGVDQPWIFLGFWALVILYTVMGGFKAVVATDIIQAAFFLILFFGCFFFTLSSETFFQNVPSEAFSFDSSKFTGWLLMPLLFMIIEQDMGQRCFSAKSEKIVSRASLGAAVITLVTCVIPVFYGILGKVKGIEIASGSSVFMQVVSNTTTPLITSFIGCAILAAIISTADSLMNAISSNLTLDFDFKNKSIKRCKIVTAGIAAAALLISFAFNNVVDLLILSYELSVSALFVPIFMALFIKKGNVLSATLSIALGALCFGMTRFMEVPFLPKEIMSLLFSGVGYAAGEILTLGKKTEEI